MSNLGRAIAVALLVWLNFACPAVASTCRSLNGYNICILSIQRSAKYFWEYRVALSIDGEARPVEKYNCRDRVQIRANGDLAPFEPHGVGELVCRLAQPRI